MGPKSLVQLVSEYNDSVQKAGGSFRFVTAILVGGIFSYVASLTSCLRKTPGGQKDSMLSHASHHCEFFFPAGPSHRPHSDSIFVDGPRAATDFAPADHSNRGSACVALFRDIQNHMGLRGTRLSRTKKFHAIA